jgi:hypothetical protein
MKIIRVLLKQVKAIKIRENIKNMEIWLFSINLLQVIGLYHLDLIVIYINIINIDLFFFFAYLSFTLATIYIVGLVN